MKLMHDAAHTQQGINLKPKVKAARNTTVSDGPPCVVTDHGATIEQVNRC
jgi:hypothetical protein